MGLLMSIVNASNYTKYLSLSNQIYMTQPTLINSHLNEYSQEPLFTLSLLDIIPHQKIETPHPSLS